VTDEEADALAEQALKALPIGKNRRNEIRDRYFAISEQRRGV